MKLIDMIKLLSVILGGTLILACSVLLPAKDKIADKIALGVVEYCNAFDNETREEIRQSINGKLGDSSIVVNCGK